jgi:outer membrane lipoprotein carrier protein
LCLALLAATCSGHAQTPAKELAGLLEPVQRMNAQFTQTVLGVRHELLQSAEGYLRLARPQQFKWVLLAPYPQTIVTSGDRVYIYDPDLNQVQVRSLDEALRGTPAMILLGTAADIEARFTVSHALVDGSDAFVLVPKDPDALYTEIRMAFSGRRMVSIEIVDSLGQLTDVSFHNVEINGDQAADEFQFSVPPDADLIGDVTPTA